MCGPTPMIRPAVDALVEKGMAPEPNSVNVEVQMERRMARCGYRALGD